MPSSPDPDDDAGGFRTWWFSTILGRYLRGEPVPKFWERTFYAILWTASMLIQAEAPSDGTGSGSGGSKSVRYDGGSCVCGSAPKLCGKFPHCKWKPTVEKDK
jgi:hypothetical protein